VRQLAELIARSGADVAHTHGYLANVVADRAARARRTPVVTTVHGAPEPFHGLRALRMQFNLYLDRRAMRRPRRRVIAVADFVAEELARRGVPRERIAVVRNGLPPLAPDPSLRHENRLALELPPDAVAFSFVGRLEPVKDPLAFVEFARLVHDYNNNTAFVVAGDGPLLEPMRERVLAEGLLPHFRFLGFVNDLNAVFSASDVYVLSSRHEGVPLAALEAMRAGVPTIAPAVGGLPEVLGGLDGLLAPDRDPRQLAALAIRLLNDKTRLAKASAEARARFLERFTAEEMVERVVRVYHEAVAELS
jgi:glycosyltransferase involved in cell wall biosynthesis